MSSLNPVLISHLPLLQASVPVFEYEPISSSILWAAMPNVGMVGNSTDNRLEEGKVSTREDFTNRAAPKSA